MPPMHLGMANLDGTLTEKFMNYYEERAKGGTGLIITEIVRVNEALLLKSMELNQEATI